MKIKFATNKFTSHPHRVWVTAAIFLPLLTACSSGDSQDSWFSWSSSSGQKADSSYKTVSTAKTGAFNQAACGLFFGQNAVSDHIDMPVSEDETSGISLDENPQETLLQAIAYDMRQDYEPARRLYVWLTATPPDMQIDLDCGQGVRLSGSINSLAQRRLIALDASVPEFARSDEIDSVIATATVAAGPELPTPPKVDRDTRFYEASGAINAEPEVRTGPVVRMDMPVSSNTAQLTRVDKRPQVKPDVGAPARSSSLSSTPTIAGSAASTEHDGAVIASNNRPVAQGTLDIGDQKPALSMIEIPIGSQSAPAPAVARSKAPQPPKIENTAPSENVVKQTKAASDVTASPEAPSATPYYAAQLAAYRSRERAESAWVKFQNTANGVLSAADHEVVSIAIEGKGLYFRLLTGKYGTSSEARQACNDLKTAGIDCLVRRVTP